MKHLRLIAIGAIACLGLAVASTAALASARPHATDPPGFAAASAPAQFDLRGPLAPDVAVPAPEAQESTEPTLAAVLPLYAVDTRISVPVGGLPPEPGPPYAVPT